MTRTCIGLALSFCTLAATTGTLAQSTSKPPARTVAKTAATPAATPRTAAGSPAEAVGFRNADVIQLVKAGFGDDLVAARIRQAQDKAFDLSTRGLVQLKESGVSERVIALMMDATVPATAAVGPAAHGPAAAAGPAPASGSPDATAGGSPEIAARDSGIYLKTASDFVPLEPTVFTGGKTGGILTSGLTMGIKKAKWKALVRSTRANQRVTTPDPEFYFYFESRTGLGSPMMFNATSPNEFVLVRMNQKSDERELVVGEFGMFGASAGMRSEDSVPLAIERLRPGVYRVKPTARLEAGEYCFFHAVGSGFMTAGGGKLFDFGVDLQ